MSRRGIDRGRCEFGRNAASIAVIEDSLFVVGGYSGSGFQNTVERASVNPDGSIQSFGTAGNPTLVTARCCHASAVIGSNLYVFGGEAGGSKLASVERAAIGTDGTLGTFGSTGVPELTGSRSYHCGVVLGDYVYVVGGAGDGGLVGTVERSFIAAGGALGGFTVAGMPALETARKGQACAVVGDYLYLIGGNGASAILSSVERSQIAGASLNGFTSAGVPPLNIGRRNARAAVVGPYLYVFGGETGDDTGFLAATERALIGSGGTIGPFTALGPGYDLEAARPGHATVLLGSFLYHVGGYDGTRLSSVEAMKLR